MVADDPEAVLAASPIMPPTLRPKPLFEMSFQLKDINPEFIDILMYGQSPGPHIILGEE